MVKLCVGRCGCACMRVCIHVNLCYLWSGKVLFVCMQVHAYVNSVFCCVYIYVLYVCICVEYAVCVFMGSCSGQCMCALFHRQCSVFLVPIPGEDSSLFVPSLFQYEILFCTQSEDDPSLRTVKELMEEYPNVDVQVFASELYVHTYILYITLACWPTCVFTLAKNLSVFWHLCTYLRVKSQTYVCTYIGGHLYHMLVTWQLWILL